ncbi:MAG: MrcB family domain-containing protein [Metamycoplasmataceae bacterium]
MESVYNFWISFNKVVSKININTSNEEKQKIWLEGKLEIAKEFSVNSQNYKEFINKFKNNEIFNKISVSTGQGRLANTPWISFLNNEISTDLSKGGKSRTSTSNGFYPVILFDRDGIYIAATFAIHGIWNKYDEIVHDNKISKKLFQKIIREGIRNSLLDILPKDEKMITSFWYHDFPKLINAPNEYLDPVWTGIYINGEDITDENVKIALKKINDHLVSSVKNKRLPNNCELFNSYMLDILNISKVSNIEKIYDKKEQNQQIVKSRTESKVYSQSEDLTNIEILDNASVTELIEDIEEIRSDGTLNPTEKEILYKARIGQGKYRDDLLEEYKQTCVLSGVNFKELLVASHIVPWREANNKERIDKYNGLLLSASIDKLFDRYLISFDEDGKLVVSKSFEKRHNFKDVMITIGIYEKYIDQKEGIEFHEQTKKYLKKHFEKTSNQL